MEASSELSRVSSGDVALALRQPMLGRIHVKPNFARAPDIADDEIVLGIFVFYKVDVKHLPFSKQARPEFGGYLFAELAAAPD